jgi:rhamnose transport system substrate-binding protein
MKKVLFLMLSAVFMVSMVLMGISCKEGAAPAEEEIEVALSFVVAGIPYGESCSNGAQSEADKLGIGFSFIAPTTADSAQQVNQIQDAISKGVQGVGICSVDPESVRGVVQDADEAGVKVVGWDAGISDENFIYVSPLENLVTARHLADVMAELIGYEGQIAILTGLPANTVLNERVDEIKRYVPLEYPDIEIVAVETGEDDQQKSMVVATNLMTAYPDIKGIIANTSATVPGAGQAVLQAEKAGVVMVNGLTTPNQVKDLVHQGVIQSVTLWDTEVLGGVTVRVLYDLIKGVEYKDGDKIEGYPDYVYTPEGNMVLNLKPLDFTKDNIDDYDF